MNHEIPDLQVRIHKVDGSISTFVQNDVKEAKAILDEFDPALIFHQERITISDKNSVISLTVQQITRIDLVSERQPHLIFPVGIVDAVELTESEFQTLIRNPLMREQWEEAVTQDTSLVTFMEVEMADGQCLFLTTESLAELQSELWRTKGFPLEGPGLCFRMRGGGVSVLNLVHLTCLSFFPKPPQLLAEAWAARQFHPQMKRHAAIVQPRTAVVVNPPPTPPSPAPLFP